MNSKLKYPDDFHKPNTVGLDNNSIQRLVDAVLMSGESSEQNTGDILIKHVVEEKGVYEIVEIYRLEGRSGNIMEQ